MLTGLLGVIMSFVPTLRLWGLIAVLLIVIVVPVVYSFVIYQRYTVEGKEPLSPPFDPGDNV